jgi:hypothetical protein
VLKISSSDSEGPRARELDHLDNLTLKKQQRAQRAQVKGKTRDESELNNLKTSGTSRK